MGPPVRQHPHNPPSNGSMGIPTNPADVGIPITPRRANRHPSFPKNRPTPLPPFKWFPRKLGPPCQYQNASMRAPPLPTSVSKATLGLWHNLKSQKPLLSQKPFPPPTRPIVCQKPLFHPMESQKPRLCHKPYPNFKKPGYPRRVCEGGWVGGVPAAERTCQR